MERYRDQLEGYARLFVNEDMPIHLGLYFPMTTGWIEWEFERQRSVRPRFSERGLET